MTGQRTRHGYTPMQSGLYALMMLDGLPLRAGDLAALGFDHTAGATVVAGVDQAFPQAVSRACDGKRTTVLVGRLDDASGLAEHLRLRQGATPADVARAALDRYGTTVSREMPGEWSLLDWRANVLTVATSTALRDPVHYVRHGDRLAIAPDLACLRSLTGAETSLDAEGLLFSFGRAAVRTRRDGQTVLPGARALANGACLIVDRQSMRETPAPALPVDPPWRESFADAMAACEALLRVIVRDRLRSVDAVACMLSGGLDSSLLAWLTASERAPDTALRFLCSAAPPGSGLGDETAFARLVADHLRVPIAEVTPARDAAAYRCSPATLAASNGPSLSPRHYLVDAFADSAAGAPLMIDGAYGEASLSGFDPDQPPGSLGRRLLGHARKIANRWSGVTAASPFHVRLAPHVLATLPPAVATAAEDIDAGTRRSSSFSEIEREAVRRSSWRIPTELRAGGMRLDSPLRDPRLLRLFSRLPSSFLTEDGIDRAPVRHLLRDRVPEAVRLRPKGGAFSPDYLQRLRRQAPDALGRREAWRRGGAAEWLDLTWLEEGLSRFAARGPRDVGDAFEVQQTALAAEFIIWWNGEPSP